ncbi:MAG: TetR family transcriptional regulator [Pseudomonadota bacterium]
MERQAGTEKVSKSKGERSREQLLEAALRIIADRGVGAVTHRSIADEAGLTRGAVTYHFASRDEILLAAFRHYIETVHSLIDEVSQDKTDKSLDELIETMVQFHQQEFFDPDRVLAEYELIVFAARHQDIRQEFRTWENRLITQIEAQLDQIGFEDGRLTATVMLAVARAFELEHLTHPESDPDELRRRLRAVLSGAKRTDEARLKQGETA